MKVKRLFPMLVIVVLASLLFAAPVLALQEGPTNPAQSPTVEYLVQLLFGLSVSVPGFATLGVVIVNILKTNKWVKDSSAPAIFNIINVLFAVFIGIASTYTKWDIPGLDVKFAALSDTLTILLPAFVLLSKWLAPIIHGAIRGFPILGHSYSMLKSEEK